MQNTLLFAFVLPLLVWPNQTSTAKDFCTAKGENCPDKNREASTNQEQHSTPKEEDSISSTGMEWFSHGVNNDDLISQLKNHKIIKSTKVEEAMRKVDRGNFCTNRPYQDSPQYIGYGITISAPHMHAHALEMLKDKLVEGARVLDVGSGDSFCTPFRVFANGIYLCVCLLFDVITKRQFEKLCG